MTSLFRPYLKRFSRLCFRAPACTRRFNCVVQSLFLCCPNLNPFRVEHSLPPPFFFGVHLRLERCLFYVNNVTSFLRFTPLHDPAVSRPLPTAITTTIAAALFYRDIETWFTPATHRNAAWLASRHWRRLMAFGFAALAPCHQ